MTEGPFVHSKALVSVKTSFAYHDEISKILFKILDNKGVINIGGKSQFIYDFAKKDNKKLKRIYLKRGAKIGIPFDSSISISKLKKLLR